MALGTVVVNITIPESISSANPDQVSRAIAVNALRQAEQAIGSGLAASGSSVNLIYNVGGANARRFSQQLSGRSSIP
jgi:hypothetical protein